MGQENTRISSCDNVVQPLQQSRPLSEMMPDEPCIEYGAHLPRSLLQLLLEGMLHAEVLASYPNNQLVCCMRKFLS
uniref:Uncharacterized protein n=1 Tax=Arundo donax TaxID=35708 RepID=A0A0A9FSS3_ARUDO